MKKALSHKDKACHLNFRDLNQQRLLGQIERKLRKCRGVGVIECPCGGLCRTNGLSFKNNTEKSKNKSVMLVGATFFLFFFLRKWQRKALRSVCINTSGEMSFIIRTKLWSCFDGWYDYSRHEKRQQQPD